MAKLQQIETDDITPATSIDGIRRCSDSCNFFKDGGGGCTFYQNNEVKYGEVCLFDVDQLKQYVENFESGSGDKVKKDAAEITAMLVMSLRRMLHEISIEGPIVRQPLLDGRRMPVWMPDPNWREGDGERQQVLAMEVKDHPLLQRVIQLAKSIGISLSEFRLTPKSADERGEVSGHILDDGPMQLEDVMKDREQLETNWITSVREGDKALKEDPVYRELKEADEIIQ